VRVTTFIPWIASTTVALGLASPASTMVFPGDEWETRSPSDFSMSENAFDELAAMVGGSGMIVREGYVIYTWGNPATDVNWASASKPVTSTMLWMAVDEGRCSLDTQVGAYLTNGTVKDEMITLHQLANMISGYSRAEWPGLAWAYNDHAIQLFGHLVYEEIFGMSPQAAFESRLSVLGFQDPIDVSDDQIGRIRSMSIRDFARIGHLWLNRGNWNGTQLVSDHFFDLVTNQVPGDLATTPDDFDESWDLGTFGGPDDQLSWGPGHYGYTFWVNTNDLWPGLWPRAFQANGHWGLEMCTVIPELDLVVVSADGDWGHPSTAPLWKIHDSVSILGVGDGDGDGDGDEDGQAIEAPVSWTRLKGHYDGRLPRHLLTETPRDE